MPAPFTVVLTPLLLGISWMEPQFLLDSFGGALIWFSLAIIFVECGLFFPFLPGDTLLFALGLFIAGDQIHVFGVDSHVVELISAIVLLTVAGFLGNVAGYEIGRKVGPPLYRRDGRILKRKYLDNTRFFFERHGNKALVIGRFVPFVRTYITLVAGITQMQRRRFFVWSAVGAVAWVVSITLLGFFLGQVSWIGDNLDYAMIAIALFTIIPLILEAIRHKATQDSDDTDDESDTEQSEPAEAR